ncbi:carbohydrate kinase [Frisingicoccus sp.]|uniref:carbohydrate kinase family protein n=1 Tax=Frisingicoccus sp. TaxID=1918627 RepID=UPI002EA30CAE|nr:carbohydrate kinase [Frisingicoccus sp.]
MYDVIALGELLVDFIQEGVNENGFPLFCANPAGAPCNVLAMVTKFGRKASFIGKVGNDAMGYMLRDTLIKNQIGIENLVMDDKVPTTLVFVSKTDDGDRSFSFYRNPGADMMLKESDVDLQIIQKAKVFHFGTLSMTHKENQSVTKKAVEYAKAHHVLVSFDPNIREPLWESMDLLRQQMAYGMSRCDILKISDNEIQWFTGETDYDKAVTRLKSEYNIPLIFLTLGKYGSRAYYKDVSVEVSGYPVDEVVDATGAGDTFLGIALSKVLDFGLENLDGKNLEEILKYANMGASIITQRKGTLAVMPEKKEIEEKFSLN